jgi:hypothetical protein
MPLNMLSGSPSAGRTAYGTVPAPIPTPPSVFSQLNEIPGFKPNTASASSVIGSQLAGNVSPGTLNALKTGAAQFGVGSGLGFGSGLETNQLFGNIAGFSEGQSQRGVQNYLSEVGALGPTMTNPNLAAEISARNANLAAAPDPKLAAQADFDAWLKGFGIVSSAGTPNAPWAAGGTLGPASGFSTTHSNYGGMGGLPPDDLGFPGYDMRSQQGYGTMTATATPPPGGWPAEQPWNAGFATGVSNNPFFYTGEEGAGYSNPAYGEFADYTGG